MIHRKATKRKIKFARRLRRKQTRAERAFGKIAKELQEEMGYKFWPQVVLFGWIVDFWCPKLKLLVEIDGATHDDTEEYDRMRSEVLTEETGAEVVRFSNAECLTKAAAVKVKLRRLIKKRIKAESVAQ